MAKTRKPKEKLDIKEKILWAGPAKQTRGGKEELQLRIISWIVDGVEHEPQFEKRQFFVSPDGSRKLGKPKGLKRDDINFLIENFDEIGLFFNNNGG